MFVNNGEKEAKMEKSEHAVGSLDWAAERIAQVREMFEDTELKGILTPQGEPPKAMKWSGINFVKYRLRSRGVLSLEIWEPKEGEPYVRIHHSKTIAKSPLAKSFAELGRCIEQDENGANLAGAHMEIARALAHLLAGAPAQNSV